jgi:hypothetical protein
MSKDNSEESTRFTDDPERQKDGSDEKVEKDDSPKAKEVDPTQGGPKSSLHWIAAPALSGKSTSAGGNVYDIDQGEAKIPQDELARIELHRKAKEWVKLNALRDPYLKEWLKTLPDGAIVLSHHPDDSMRLAGQKTDAVVLISQDEFSKRLDREGDETRHDTAIINRQSVMESKGDLPVFSTIDEAIKSLDTSPMEDRTEKKEPTAVDAPPWARKTAKEINTPIHWDGARVFKIGSIDVPEKLVIDTQAKLMAYLRDNDITGAAEKPPDEVKIPNASDVAPNVGAKKLEIDSSMSSEDGTESPVSASTESEELKKRLEPVMPVDPNAGVIGGPSLSEVLKEEGGVPELEGKGDKVRSQSSVNVALMGSGIFQQFHDSF